MDMNFTKVSFDGDLDEIDDADELRGLVREFESAQDSNISEFKDAKDTLEDFEVRVGEAQDFKEDLAETLTEVSPLSEDEAMSYEMSRMRELIAEFADDGAAEESEEDEGGSGTFGDMGSSGETHTDDDTADFAKERLGKIGGLSI